MPTMWTLKDGRTPYTESGAGVPLNFDEAVAVFGTEDIRYLGAGPASIGPDRSSDTVENVVLQLDDDEGSNPLLPQPGFYWVISVRPEVVVQRLSAERGGR